MLPIYKEKLEQIRTDLFAIGTQIVEANEIALKAIEIKNFMLFKDAKNTLSNIDKRSSKIDNMIVATLALYSPEARDLRSLVSYLKIINDIVRAGTNTKRFIKSFSKVTNYGIDLDKINKQSALLLQSAIEAFKTSIGILFLVNGNEIEDNFHKVVVEESKSDDLYSMIEKTIFEIIAKDRELSKDNRLNHMLMLELLAKNRELTRDYLDLLSSLRRLEKVADRAVSIANLLLYAHFGGEIQRG